MGYNARDRFRVADVEREGTVNKVTNAPQIYPQPMVMRRLLQSKI